MQFVMKVVLREKAALEDHEELLLTSLAQKFAELGS